MRRLVWGIVALALGVGMAAAIFSQAKAGKRETQPGDVFAHVGLLSAEVELVRREIGAPKESRPAVVVDGAQPRDNYFQALSLSRKVQRLCSDLTGDDGVFPPSAPAPDLTKPADVLAVVDATLSNARRVKAHLRISELSREPPLDDSKTPSDVFRSIVHLNRQFSLMLDTRPTPSGVYERLTEAVVTANRLLARFPGAAEVKTPPFDRGRAPADVHARLMRCMDQVHLIMKHLGPTTLEVDWKLAPEQVAPSDVYDLAMLLLAELRYLESRIPRTPGSPALTDIPPGRKLPAHNFQRAGLIEAQLVEIRKQIEANPDSLKQQ
ncbi:MAG: hypothetical protein ACLQNE_46195 [Thermoguttaceae bacterium]